MNPYFAFILGVILVLFFYGIALYVVVISGVAFIFMKFLSRRKDRRKGILWDILSKLSTLFPYLIFILLVTVILRFFVFNWFTFKAGSMLPTLHSGDIVLVNTHSFSIKIPFTNQVLVKTGEPKRGNLVAFIYPVDTSQIYAQRVVGIPGDEVAYINNKLTINGKSVPLKIDGDYFDPDRMSYTHQFIEILGGHEYKILLDDKISSNLMPIMNFQFRENCKYQSNGLICKVPADSYFLLGDNRNNSLDSRFWGFVPENYIIGKIFFIGMNWSNFGRIGSVK